MHTKLVCKFLYCILICVTIFKCLMWRVFLKVSSCMQRLEGFPPLVPAAHCILRQSRVAADLSKHSQMLYNYKMTCYNLKHHVITRFCAG